MRVRARHYCTGEKIEVRLGVDQIDYLGPPISDPFGARAIVRAGWVAPALFDLQINGCLGISFNAPTLTPADVGRVVAECRRHGIAGLLPTLVTNSREAIVHGLTTIRQAVEQDAAVRSAVPGCHLEGPSVSPEDGPRGAHPRAHVRPPDWDEFRGFQDAAGGRIRLVTLAPEHEGALPFIEKLTAAGVVVALGHTAASGERLRDAVTAGARLSTHLGNGCAALLPRHENVIWEQLADDRLWASAIADGHHLPPAVLKSILRVKTPARMVLTCDAGSLAGLPPGPYREWGQDLEVRPEGRIVLAGTPYLAGSAVFTDTCVGHAANVGGVSLAAAVDMAGARPRELLGLRVPRLAEGTECPVMMFDWQPGERLEVRGVF